MSLPPEYMTQASRDWTEIGSDANVADALLRRQHCMVLSIAATLELYDLRQVNIRLRFIIIAHRKPAIPDSRYTKFDCCTDMISATTSANIRRSATLLLSGEGMQMSCHPIRDQTHFFSSHALKTWHRHRNDNDIKANQGSDPDSRVTGPSDRYSTCFY